MGETSFLQILLMIVFRRIELRRGIDLRHNRPLIFAVPLQFLLRGFRGGLLFRSKEKHGGSILRPNVRTLPVQCRGVMVCPKNFEQLLIGYFGRVVLPFASRRMMGGAGEDVLVREVIVVYAGAADC